MAVTNMKKMMAHFSMKSMFLVLLLLFFVYLLSTYFMAKQGWYEGMATEPDAKKTETETEAKAENKDDKKVDATEADAKKAQAESKPKTETKTTEKDTKAHT